MEEMKSMLEKVTSIKDEVNVDLVFGKPQQIGERTLIPVAELQYGFGFGAGVADTMPEGEELANEAKEAEGEAGAVGGGGGAGAKARPIAYIEVGPEGTKVESIVDEQKIALAGILLSVWAVGWIGKVLKALFSPRQ